MSDSTQNTAPVCICPHLPALRRRRRKRRNYSNYRDYTVTDLRTALQAGLAERPDLLERFFPEPDDATKEEFNPSNDCDSDNLGEYRELDESEIEIPVNCPHRTPDEFLVPIDGAFYFHIRSKINLGKKILSKDEAKTILETQSLHYSRACRVGLINYSIQDDHFHLLIAVQTSDYLEAREKASKMIGCIKQQFTKRFKLWYNEFYVRERRHRVKPLPRGTLWDGRAEIEFIANEAELMACVLYIESNYLKIRAAAEIQTLESPPLQPGGSGEGGKPANTPYQALEQHLLAHKYQSGGWYVGGRKGHTTALSDGYDGNWLTGKELEYWWNKPVSSYPRGWRKVWFKKGGGILMVTPDHRRRYHKHPILDLLAKGPARSGRVLKHLVLTTCWENRARVWVSDFKTQEEPGANEF